MGIYDSEIWIADLEETLRALPELESLAGESVMITGSSGLIGSALTDLLIRWNETHDRKIRLFAAGRDVRKIRRRFDIYAREPWFHSVFYDAAATERLDFSCDYIIHGASNAFPGAIAREPVETMLGNFLGMNRLLDYAKSRDVKRVLYLSTSEVYGKTDGKRPYREGDYGYVDLLNPRNSYAVGKRATETLCASYAHEYGVESVIARPGHVYGPTASPTDDRVSSAWAYAAARGEDIVMKSDGLQVRSYCYCLDCASALIKILLKGESVRAYNISNPDSVVTIRRMAEILSRVSGVNVRTAQPTESERKRFNPMNHSSLDGAALSGLGWRGNFNAEKGFAHTVETLKKVLCK